MIQFLDTHFILLAILKESYINQYDSSIKFSEFQNFNIYNYHKVGQNKYSKIPGNPLLFGGFEKPYGVQGGDPCQPHTK